MVAVSKEEAQFALTESFRINQVGDDNGHDGNIQQVCMELQKQDHYLANFVAMVVLN